jgi:glycosyltransferase involved in cell wall biosynthesis
MSSVSVVIPCYRYGHFLEQSAGSALTGQDGVDVKVLIIDDCSPDDSAAGIRVIDTARCRASPSWSPPAI